MKNTTHLPLKRKWTGPVVKSGKMNSAYMGLEVDDGAFQSSIRYKEKLH